MGVQRVLSSLDPRFWPRKSLIPMAQNHAGAGLDWHLSQIRSSALKSSLRGSERALSPPEMGRRRAAGNPPSGDSELLLLAQPLVFTAEAQTRGIRPTHHIISRGWLAIELRIRNCP